MKRTQLRINPPIHTHTLQHSTYFDASSFMIIFKLVTFNFMSQFLRYSLQKPTTTFMVQIKQKKLTV